MVVYVHEWVCVCVCTRISTCMCFHHVSIGFSNRVPLPNERLQAWTYCALHSLSVSVFVDCNTDSLTHSTIQFSFFFRVFLHFRFASLLIFESTVISGLFVIFKIESQLSKFNSTVNKYRIYNRKLIQDFLRVHTTDTHPCTQFNWQRKMRGNCLQSKSSKINQSILFLEC